MTLTLTLPPDVEAKLRQRAAELQQSPDEYASRVLAQAVTARTVDEILAPFRKQVAESGMSDEELDAFYRQQLSAVRREKKAKSA
jgi:plasmid stability protein